MNVEGSCLSGYTSIGGKEQEEREKDMEMKMDGREEWEGGEEWIEDGDGKDAPQVSWVRD